MPRLIPLAGAALLLLGGCSKPEPVSVENGTEALSANLEQMANELEAEAAGQVNATERETLTDAAATLDNASDAVNLSDTTAND
ncbi:hypothetical protein SAMN05216382_2955 [Sphingomonas palmae]|uniref:Uncharacterized protein n=1 Tax=Sphingomonas palmae TaxID=1855283 RepID=A0A1H7U854_9SPHN|nr:hypothetical protein [Sphingomonas palmae]SEL92828.1 hypothetical protein SAMN05216382_2955 [Sphingomonas palmae]